jgi:hypothetical protein
LDALLGLCFATAPMVAVVIVAATRKGCPVPTWLGGPQLRGRSLAATGDFSVNLACVFRPRRTVQIRAVLKPAVMPKLSRNSASLPPKFNAALLGRLRSDYTLLASQAVWHYLVRMYYHSSYLLDLLVLVGTPS